MNALILQNVVNIRLLLFIGHAILGKAGQTPGFSAPAKKTPALGEKTPAPPQNM